MTAVKYKLISAALCASLLLTTACGQLDVIGNASVRSLSQVVTEADASWDEQMQMWSLSAPDGAARFLWNEDTALLEVDLTPFVEAGLDPAALLDADGGRLIGERLEADARPGEPAWDSKLLLGDKWDPDAVSRGGAASVEAYSSILRSRPEVIGYHMAMDHFNIDLGNGHMFEWAKDLQENDKDIVFVLSPEPFREAGVDLEQIPGWTLDEVEVMDGNGGHIMVDKLLKPFDLA